MPTFKPKPTKNIKVNKRTPFLNNIFKEYDLFKFTFRNIYNDIKKDKELLKLESLKIYYIDSVKRFINETLEQIDIPMEKIKIEPKWPNNAENN